MSNEPIVDWFGVREQAHLRAGGVQLYDPGTSVRVFAVRNADKTLDESSALFHPDIPTIRSPHPTRPYLWLSDKQARQADEKNGEIWEVVCTYTLATGGEFPWQEPPVYQWGSQATEQICDFDVVSNKPIRNSAGVPFDPAVTATRFESTLTVSRNELNFSQATAMQYTGAVNSQPFKGAAVGFCMCVGIPAVLQYHVDEGGVRRPYWSVQYVFAFRNKFSWQPKILDAGYVKRSESGSLVPITIAGREPSCAVPLKNGQPLANPETDDPSYLDFKVYPELNFSALGI